MAEEILPEEIRGLLASLRSKRARVLVKHVLEHGVIRTEDLERTYGYKHPPRAARDVREAGIPLKTVKVKSSDGRTIAGYELGDLSEIEKDKLGGRRIFPSGFRDRLYERSGGKCDICQGRFEGRYLQIDHRIPYEVSGDDAGLKRVLEHYMLLCSSCNRAKSWSCEHCPNWLTEKSPNICSKCYWAEPDDHRHIALREIRRLDIIWDEEEIEVYERLKALAEDSSHPIPDYVKKIIEKHLD